MKVVAVNGSPRKKGNIDALMKRAVKVLEDKGIEVETISLGDAEVRPCDACGRCYSKAWDCPIDDAAEEVLKKMAKADGLLIGSPVYFGGVTAQLKALFDRSIMAYQAFELKDKVLGALSCGGASHGGQELTVWQIVMFGLTHDMIVANSEGGLYGAMATGNDPGDVRKDDEGLKSAEALARRMIALLEKTRD